MQNPLPDAGLAKEPPKTPTLENASVARPAGVAPDLMTPRALAAKLDISVETLGRWRRGKRGPKCVQSGGFIRYRAQDVEAWLAAGGDVKDAI